MLPPPYSPMKHHQSDEEAHSRSDASSHGMGNVADTEMDVSPNGTLGAENTRQVREKHSDSTPPPLPPAPAKKKRTRTLTTPHQSAVLHALLAQSRFPTTAMREEVGRSIGLSARKVQVWFQNQRQKARRPRNQGSAPPARPPQYGAFPNASALSSAHSTLIPSSLPSSDETTRSPFYAAPHSAPFIQFSVSREYSSSHESVFGSCGVVTNTSTSPGGHLSGPGVPGAGLTSTFIPRYPQPMRPPQPVESSPEPRPSRDAHPSSARQLPIRDFTFTHPFPASGAAPYLGGQYPPAPSLPPTPHPPLGSLGRPPSRSPQSAFAPESRPQTPGSSFLVPRGRLDSARDLPRLKIPPLHVPDSPPPTHAHQHKQHKQQQQQRSTARYSFSPPQFPARSFSHPPSERALPSATSCSCSSSRGESSPAPSSRTRRFDPVHDAASEYSGSQGTDASTPPYIIDTPHA